MTSHKIILLGELGSGKSSVMSYLCQQNLEADSSSQSTPSLGKISFRDDKRGLIEIVDTPTFNSDLASSFTKTIQNAQDTLNFFNGGFDLIVYCMPAETRTRTAYLEHMLFLKSLFGEENLSHVCIMITNLNQYIQTRREELRNTIEQDLPEKLNEWGLGSIEKIFFLDSETPKCDQASDPFFDYMESKGYIDFVVEPLNDHLNPLCALNNEHIHKYLSYITKKQKEAYALSQNILLSRNKTSDDAEIGLRVLEGFKALEEEENLNSLLLSVKGSYVPFVQDVVNYFERKTVNQSISLIKDISEILKESYNPNILERIFKNINTKELVERVQGRIFERILKSAAMLFSKKIGCDQESIKHMEKKLKILLEWSSQLKTEEISQMNSVVKISLFSSTVTFGSLFFINLPLAVTSTVAVAVTSLKSGDSMYTKNAMEKISVKIYDELYQSKFSKMLFICMLIIYSDLDESGYFV